MPDNERINEQGEKVTVYEIVIRAEAEVIKAADIKAKEKEEEKHVGESL
jgi:hypothetical protein